MLRLAVITEADTDMLDIMRGIVPELVVLKPGQLCEANLDEYEAIAILGGGTGKPIVFAPRDRVSIERQVNKGTRIFAEFCTSIGKMFCTAPENTRYERLALCSSEYGIAGLAVGDLIDDQCGMRMKPHPGDCSRSVPILQYVKTNEHDRVEVTDEMLARIPERALWFEKPGNVLVCSFRLANFVRARFAPQERVMGIVKFILSWLLDGPVRLDDVRPVYQTGRYDPDLPLVPQVRRSAELAMKWFAEAGILINGGKDGVVEGVASEIYPSGEQRTFHWIRSDCIGETSMAYFMHYLLTGEDESLVTSDALIGFVFQWMQCTEAGELHGMMRWTDEQWDVCYQDDVARAIIPQMLKCLYTGRSDFLQESLDALAFLVRTTGSDGTRIYCTYNSRLDTTAIARMTGSPGQLPSAHFNAYYHAALLLAFKLTGNETFRETAIRGLTTIMSSYPRTYRVLSETQEYCRLILPLSWLYWVTGDSEHKEWLYRVAQDLQRFRHRSGAYVEWDEGYSAMMRRKIGEDENSLLARNGDQVVDLLYSNNWLPAAFMQAYFVTKDPYFRQLWEDSAAFIVSSQIHSGNSQINGGWARAFDPEKMEVYGSPADNSWGPWAIESGWTVAEIASGLMMGLLEERLANCYDNMPT